MTTWNTDPSHSHVTFSAKHMGIFTVRGLFEKFAVDFKYDEQNPALSTVRAQIEAASINTKEANRDAHLKSPDFLNAAEFPHLTFTSKRVAVSGGQGVVVGDLTIRDITREVTLDVEYLGKATSPWGVESAAFRATTTIDRREWNLTWNVALETGGLLVSNEIKIEIELEAMKVTEPVEAAAA